MKTGLISLYRRLEELGLELPAISAPIASYTPAKAWKDLIFVSGQLPFKDGSLLMLGQMTPERDLAQAQNAMVCCFLNGLAAAAEKKIKGVLKLGAYTASSADFTQHHLVANGASNLAQSLFGEEGVHTRFAVGLPSLPMNSTVELEMIFYT